MSRQPQPTLYTCDHPGGCDAREEVPPGSPHNPSGWWVDRGRQVSCPEHSEAIREHIDAELDWTSARLRALARLRTVLQEGVKAWEADNPKPVHPWGVTP